MHTGCLLSPCHMAVCPHHPVRSRRVSPAYSSIDDVRVPHPITVPSTQPHVVLALIPPSYACVIRPPPWPHGFQPRPIHIHAHISQHHANQPRMTDRPTGTYLISIRPGRLIRIDTGRLSIQSIITWRLRLGLTDAAHSFGDQADWGQSAFKVGRRCIAW